MPKRTQPEGTPPGNEQDQYAHPSGLPASVAEALEGVLQGEVSDPDSEADETDGPLSPREELFCHEYLIDLCGTKAVVRTPGYTENPASAAVQASRLLRRVKVQRRIRELKAETFHRLAVTRERILEGLAELAFADPGEVMDFEDSSGVPAFKHSRLIPGHARRAIKKLKVKRVFPKGDDPADPHEIIEMEWHDRRAPLETLAKIEGMLEGDTQPGALTFVVVVPDKAPSAEVWAAQYAPARNVPALPSGSRRKPDRPVVKGKAPVKKRRSA